MSMENGSLGSSRAGALAIVIAEILPFLNHLAASTIQLRRLNSCEY